MTSTEPRTEEPPRDVYTALERVADVSVSEHTTAAIDDVRRVIDEVGDRLVRARELLAMHEAQAQIIVDDLRSASPCEAGIELDGLYELMSQLSGARELHDVLLALSESANPDLLDSAAIGQARMQLER